MPDTKLPRYTPVLVADPTPPLPNAASAPAAVTEIPVAAAAAMRDRLGAQDARIAELESAMLDGAILSGLNYMRERDAAITRAEAAEADRDRLSAANAELSATLNRLDGDWERTCAAVRREYEPEIDALRAELAALRGAFATLREAGYSHVARYSYGSTELEKVLQATDAALATATATPQAAGTGTGGEDDTRRLAWLATELAYDWTIGEIDIAELACAYASDAGREDEDPIADDVIAALRLAIDTMMSPDTPQEAQP